jgi:hypothetical protein
LTFAGFFLVAVSPFKPSGVVWVFWSAVSCLEAGAGVNAAF